LYYDNSSEEGKPPGPITNSELLTKEGEPKPDMIVKVDYRGITKDVWNYFFDIYAGGPPIIKKSINLYEDTKVKLVSFPVYFFVFCFLVFGFLFFVLFFVLL